MRAFLGIPDCERPTDGSVAVVPVWVDQFQRFVPRAMTGATLSGFTVNQVPVGTSAGGLAGSSALTWNGTTFAVGGGITATSLTDSGLTPGRVTFATTAGLLTDSANLTYSGGTFTHGDSTASTSTTTGAVVVTGGLGVGGAINAGGDLATGGYFKSSLGDNASTTFSGQKTSTGTFANFVLYGSAHASQANRVYYFGAKHTFRDTSGVTDWIVADGTNVTLALPTLATSTTDSSSIGTGAVIVSGGIGVAKKITFGGTLTAAVNSGSTINLDLSDTAASRTVAIFRVNTSATAHTTAALMDVVSAASTSSDKMVRVRANSVDLWTVSADGTASYSGPQNISNATASTSSTTGCATYAGGVGISGSLYIGGSVLSLGANAGTAATFQFNTAASNQRGFQFQTAGVNLWSVVTSNTESGSDAGCAITFVARTDAGVTIDVPLTLNRAAGTAIAITRPLTNSSTTDSTSISTGSIITSGGIGVAKRLTLDGGTGKTLRIVNSVSNAAVAVTLGSVGPTGSTAGNPQGWMRIDIAGTDRYIPFW